MSKYYLLAILTLTMANAAYGSDCKSAAIAISDPKHSTSPTDLEDAGRYTVSEVESLSAPDGLWKYRVIRHSKDTASQQPVLSAIVVLRKGSCKTADDSYGRPARGNFDYKTLLGKWKPVTCTILDFRLPDNNWQPAYDQKPVYVPRDAAEFKITKGDLNPGKGDTVEWNAGPGSPITSDGFLNYEVPKVGDINHGSKVDSGVCDMFGHCAETLHSSSDAYTTARGFFMEYREALKGEGLKRKWSLELESETDGSLTVRTFNTSIAVIYNIENWGSEQICKYVRKQ